MSPSDPFPADVTTVFVVGDLHGFFDAAERIFTGRIGARRSDWLLPPGVGVVQVGDLLHKGPDQVRLLAKVDAAITANAGRWVQLWGNHEAAVLQGSPANWTFPEPEPDEVLEILGRWWAERTAKVAARVPTAAGDVLVTHAGLSVGWWQQHGAPTEVAPLVASLNANLGGDPDAAFGRGRILDGARLARPWFDPAAGPIWCDTAGEGWAGWLERGSTPFHQVHGHASPWGWRRNRWLAGTPAALKCSVDLDGARRRTHLTLPGGSLTSVDTGPCATTGLLGDPVLALTVGGSATSARGQALVAA